MFEKSTQPLLSRGRFFFRMMRSILLGGSLIAAGLFIGTVGYAFFEHLGFIDALLNAAMILTGMGPLHQMETTSGKLFATAYAVFSGVAFPTTIGIMMAPAVHRFLHKLHLDEADGDDDDEGVE